MLRFVLLGTCDWLLQVLMLALQGSEALHVEEASIEPTLIAEVVPPTASQSEEASIEAPLSSSDSECAICLESMQQCMHLACGHSFHSACINRWLHGDGQGRCPMCRQQANRPVRDGPRWLPREATEAEERLVLAADQGDFELVSQLLADGVDANTLASHPSLDNNTPLTAAVARGHADVVRLLLDTPSIDVNMDNEEGRTPLVCAAMNGNIAILLWLLNADGIDVNATPDGRDSALQLASANGEKDVVRALLTVTGVHVNRAVGGRTALDHAVSNGHAEIVEALRAVGAVHICPLSVLRGSS